MHCLHDCRSKTALIHIVDFGEDVDSTCQFFPSVGDCVGLLLDLNERTITMSHNDQVVGTVQVQVLAGGQYLWATVFMHDKQMVTMSTTSHFPKTIM